MRKLLPHPSQLLHTSEKRRFSVGLVPLELNSNGGDLRILKYEHSCLVYVSRILSDDTAQADLAPLTGLWSGHCGWGANIKRSRDLNRLIRVAGPDTLEVLEWANGSDYFEDPNLMPNEKGKM